jgi:hypothetical protein
MSDTEILLNSSVIWPDKISLASRTYSFKRLSIPAASFF